jgi:DNA-binding FadR family transcriptional regulator
MSARPKPSKSSPASTKIINRTTLPEILVADLAGAICRGEYAPGDRLPPIRVLAEQFGVTVATTQRAVARLEEMGLIKVLMGSGMTVLDPVQSAGPNVLPYLFRSVFEQPDRACAILADFLELRREMAANHLVRIREVVANLDPAQVDALLSGLLDNARSRDGDVSAVADADFAATRALLELRPQMAYSIVWSIFERLVRTTPELLEAMHGDPAVVAASYTRLVETLRSAESDGTARDTIEAIVAEADTKTVARFRKILLKKAVGRLN